MSLLAGELRDYVGAFKQGPVPWRDLAAEADVRCSRCRSAGCVRLHGRWRRKRITDLSTGEVFRDVPICRVVFCDQSTRSLFPAELWRGRSTITSVIEVVSHVESDGLEAAWEWARAAGRDSPVVSRRTLRRWKQAVDRRLVPSAMTWLVDLPWSDTAADRLERLLDRLGPSELLAFRAATRRAPLDKTPPKTDAGSTDSSARPVRGRLAASSSHETPRPRRPRGSWSARPLRGPPPEPLPGGQQT